MKRRALVLDANIWVRAVLGQRVREYLLASRQDVMFFAPDVAYADAKNYRPGLLEKRRIPAIQAMTVLDQLERVVRPLDAEFYQPHQADALRRIATRTTGPSWPAPWHWTAPCARKTPIFLMLVWQLGQQSGSRFIWCEGTRGLAFGLLQCAWASSHAR